MRNDDDHFKNSTMTFGQHLEDLRACLVRALLGLAMGTLIGLYYGHHVVAVIESPIRQALNRYYFPNGTPEFISQTIYFDPVALTALLSGQEPPVRESPASSRDLVEFKTYIRTSDSKLGNLTTVNATEGFVIYVQASLLAGGILASPWIFYQVWAFVGAGLYLHERRYVYTFVPISLSLFLLGVGVAFGFVFAPVLDYLFSFNRLLNLNPEIRISEWLSFALLLPLSFGIAFQLPLVMFFLDRIHVVPAQKYFERWKEAILAIFVASALLGPADPYSMLLMALPLCVLYFLGAWLCLWLPRAEHPFDEKLGEGRPASRTRFDGAKGLLLISSMATQRRRQEDANASRLMG